MRVAYPPCENQRNYHGVDKHQRSHRCARAPTGWLSLPSGE